MPDLVVSILPRTGRGCYMLRYDTGYSVKHYPVSEDTKLEDLREFAVPGVGQYCARLALAAIQAIEGTPIQEKLF